MMRDWLPEARILRLLTGTALKIGQPPIRARLLQRRARSPHSPPLFFDFFDTSLSFARTGGTGIRARHAL